MTFDIQIYAAHFGLSKRPFTLVPDPESIFWSRGHRRAAAVLDYGLMNRAPITLVTGEIGSGKTTLLRHLLDEIGDELRVAFVSNAMPGGRADLLRWVLHALGEPHDKASSYVELYQRFESLLVEEYANGRRVVVIFDEAQNLGAGGLEHLRLLTNINFGAHELVQLILVGQPELRDLVMSSTLTQLAQRISASVFLKALGQEDVGAYIHHRARVAGAVAPLFTADAVALIAGTTRGVPRLVNQLCDFALLYAFAEGEKTVTAHTVQLVIDDGLFFCAGDNRPLRLVHPGPSETLRPSASEDA